MKENKYYKTPDGTVYKILIYDDVNKMVCVQDKSHPLHNQWVHDTEYNSWVECDAYGNEIVDKAVEEIYQELFDFASLDDIVSEVPIEEKTKPIKKAKKKKDAADK